MLRRSRRVLVMAAALMWFPSTAIADSTWRLDQPQAPDPAAGVAPAPFPVPLGPVGDIKFWAPNRGLMAVAGNGTTLTGQDGIVKEGLYRYDGVRWTAFSNVCGGYANATRIAWAGPREFWVVAGLPVGNRTAANPNQPRTLCHYRDNRFVASYATAPGAADAYLSMNAATCNGPSDCWFGGQALPAPKVGAFHLHWDGTSMTTVVGPQGRPVTDLQSFAGSTYESLTISDDATNGRLTTKEAKPLLLHSIAAGAAGPEAIVADPFVSTTAPSVFSNELAALDASGSMLWAAGGHASSGTKASTDVAKQRGPLLVVKEGDGPFRELPLDASALGAGVKIVDVAADPGTSTAWLALNDPSVARAAVIAHVDSTGSILEKLTLPLAGDPDPNTKGGGTGTAAKISCPATDDCWLATSQGWIYHLAGATPLQQDDDPYLAGFQSERPPDSTTVVDRADVLPIDDSGADLPFVDPTPLPPPISETDSIVTLPPAVPQATRVKVKALSRTSIQVTFDLSARAQVQVRAFRGSALVGRSARKTFDPGVRRLTFKVPGPRRWPKRIKLDVTKA